MPRKRKIKGLKEVPFLILMKDTENKYNALIIKIDESEKQNSNFNYYWLFKDIVNDEYECEDFFVFELNEKQKKKLSEKKPKFGIFFYNGDEDIIELIDISLDPDTMYDFAENYYKKNKKEIDKLDNNYDIFNLLIKIEGEEYDEEVDDDFDELWEDEEYGESFIIED